MKIGPKIPKNKETMLKKVVFQIFKFTISYILKKRRHCSIQLMVSINGLFFVNFCLFSNNFRRIFLLKSRFN